MIRRSPSISTTGSVGPSSTRKYGKASSSRATLSCSMRSCSRGFANTWIEVGMYVSERMAVQIGNPARMAVEVRPVAGKRELGLFIKLPWRLYRNEPCWVPPLLFERKRFFDRNRNPFFKHAEAEYFLAWREGQVVGRISAHIDHNFNEFQGNQWGMFGFFECEDDS